MPIAEAVEDACSDSPYSGHGAIETNTQEIRATMEMMGRLVTQLRNSNRLTDAAVLEILGYGYEKATEE